MNYALMIKACLDKMDSIFNTAQSAGRVMTEAEQVDYEKNENEIKNFKKAIEIENKLKASKDELTSVVNTVSHITSTHDLSVEKPWDNLGDQLIAIKNFAKGSTPDQRLFKNAADGLNTKVGSDGGFAIHTTFVDTMMGKITESSELYNRATKIPLSSNSNGVSIPRVNETSRANGSRYGGVQAFWASEGSTVDLTKTSLSNLDFKLEKIMCFFKASDELMQDSMAMSAWMMKAVPAEIGFLIEDGIMSGNGNGVPTGILNSPSLIQVAKESAQSNGTIVYENIVKMYSRMPKDSRVNSAWFITAEAEIQLMLMKMDIGTGGIPVYMPAGGASGLPYATIFGRPVIALEQCKELGYTGDIVFADLSDYLVIEKGNINATSSIHVEFLTGQEVFRFTKRLNGTPYTNAALASKAKSTFTTSPYVALAARHA